MPEGQELVAVGADLSPGMLLAGYRSGLFAMPDGGELGWWSPDPRGVLLPGQVHVSRSLRRSLSRFEVSIDRSFAEVVAACADPRRPHGWISPGVHGLLLRAAPIGLGALDRGLGLPMVAWPVACSGSRWAGCSPPSRSSM